jgi:hypothetical protein
MYEIHTEVCVCVFYTFETTKSDFGKFDSIKAALENLDFRSSFYMYPVNILEFWILILKLFK